MRYAIYRKGRRWGLFRITAETGEDGELLSKHKTLRGAEIALIRHWNNGAKETKKRCNG